jgi:osmoprotectant transport system permease protein
MSAWSELWDYLGSSAAWEGDRGLPAQAWDHLRVSAFATGLAAVVAIPPAVALGHLRRGGVVATMVVNIGRAVPTFALLVLAFLLSLRWGYGIGWWPTVAALFLLALPPIFTNAYTGVATVEPSIVEAARGMGMTGREVLSRVELPAATPLVLTGVRVSAVQVVATATLGFLVGYGGLGDQVIGGFQQQQDGRMLAGALTVIALSVVTDVVLRAVERALTPWRRRRRGRGRLVVLAGGATRRARVGEA